MNRAPMEPVPHAFGQTDLREYLRVIRTRKWSIVLITGVLVTAALLFSFNQTPIYQGRAQVLVRPFTSATTQQAAPAPDLVTEQQLVSTPVVAARAAKILGTDTSLQDLLHGLHVEIVSTSQILQVAYNDPNSLFAARAANAFARGYIAYRRDQFLGQIRAALADVNGRISATQEDLAGLEERIQSATDPARKATLRARRDSLLARLGVLHNQLDTLQGLAVIQQGGGELVQRATTPGSPVSPNHIQTGILALAVGLALGVGSAFLMERLDDRLRSRQDLEERVGAPVLATVPKITGWRDAREPKLVTMAEPMSAASESYRTLRTGVVFAAAQDGLKTLLVTSPGPGEGKTTTAANLAVVLAQADKRVVLISADLRKPRIHRFFGLSNHQGLVNILAGEVHPWGALQAPQLERLRIMAAGPATGRPAEWLQSPQMGSLLQRLREQTDFVIIDTAPILVVADSLAMAPMVDGVIFVVDSEATSRHAVVQAREQLEQVGAKVVGCVMNAYDRTKSRTYEPYTHRRYAFGRLYRYADDGYGASYGNGNGGGNGNGNGRPGERLAAATPREPHQTFQA